MSDSKSIELPNMGHIHVEDVPPHIRDTAYEIAGTFYGQNKRSPAFRAQGLDEYTFAIVFWPQFVPIARECLIETLNMAGIPFKEKMLIQQELEDFQAALDPRSASLVRMKKVAPCLTH